MGACEKVCVKVCSLAFEKEMQIKTQSAFVSVLWRHEFELSLNLAE